MVKLNEEKKLQKKPNVFSRIGKKIENTKDALKYNLPSSDDVVKLLGGEEIKDMEEKASFIDEKNFRLQIGKMQKDGNTIYSPLMLRFGIEYIAKHMKLDENGEGKAIIQLWPDLAQSFFQDDAEILSFEEEKAEIEKLIKKVLGKKGKKIEIQNVADNYPDVFNAIKKGKLGIIPQEEPNLNSFQIPLTSPLPIIKYLAYYCQEDPGLMKLFYNTKPEKYIGQDIISERKPGESNSDYYSVVEVGIRLFEILNGITIQGGIGRQRVYDKIISLILFGKDKIGKSKDYSIDTVLNLNKYPSLLKLHQWINENYKNNSMQQVYIELNESSLGKIKSKHEKKGSIKSKLRKAGVMATLIATLSTSGGYVTNRIIENKNKAEQERIEQERRDYRYDYIRKTQGDNMGIMEADFQGVYQEEQSNILMAEYNISSCNKKEVLDNEDYIISNEIIDMYRNAFFTHYKSTGMFLTAEKFMELYGGQIIDKYHIPYQEPYEHFMKYKDVIENTLKYGNNIDISKCEIKETSGESELSYFIKDTHKFYRLKIVRVYPENRGGKSIDLIVGEQNKRYFLESKQGDYSLEIGVECMKDLYENILPGV